MSRIGKLPISVPDKVVVTISGQSVTVKGPLGQMEQTLHPLIIATLEGNVLTVTRANEDRQTRAFHGLYRSLLHNMVVGVSVGFKRELDVVGVGYKIELKGNAIDFQLGYSHPILFPLPDGIKATVDQKAGHIVLTGYDKHLLGQVAANMRFLRKPEPYKGKGVKYTEEKIRIKAGKAAGK